MKTQPKVSARAVQDLFTRIPWVACRAQEIIETLLVIVPMLEAGNEAGAMRAAILAEARREPEQNPKMKDIDMYVMRDCIRELDHYRDKRSVVEAALAKICCIQSNSEQLEKMLPEVKAAFGNLDQRTKEIFGVFVELMSVSGNINVDFLNEILEVVTAKPLILRNEKKLTVIVKAYDMARPINQAM